MKPMGVMNAYLDGMGTVVTLLAQKIALNVTNPVV